MFYKTTIGADIEFFTKKDRKFYVPTEKEINNIENEINSHIPVMEKQVELDGLALEIKPYYSSCRDVLKDRIQYMINKANENIRINKKSYMKIPNSIWSNIPEDYKELGCKPSMNIWEQWNLNEEAKFIPARSAGGHMHLGGQRITIKDENKMNYRDLSFKTLSNMSDLNLHTIDESKIYDKSIWNVKYKKDCDPYAIRMINKFKIILSNESRALKNYETLIPLLDLYIGIPSVLLDDSKQQVERRKVYGRAGEFRLTPYGIEYRVLSNFWAFNTILISYFYGLSRMAVNMNRSDDDEYNNLLITESNKLLNKYKSDLKDTINNANQKMAAVILDDIYKTFYDNEDCKSIGISRSTYKFIKLLYNKFKTPGLDNLKKKYNNNNKYGIRDISAYMYHYTKEESIDLGVKEYDETFNLS